MFTLTKDQQKASDSFMAWVLNPNAASNFMIISGWAGCGKSTLIAHIIKEVEKKEKVIKLLLGVGVKSQLSILPTATTNKAAKVLSDMLGIAPQTTCSLLGLKPSHSGGLVKARNYEEQRESLIIIDEANFVNCEMLQYIIEATKKTKVLFIGDKYQALMPENKAHKLYTYGPPVFSQGYPEATLSTIKRNDGAIAALATSYRMAVMGKGFPLLKANDIDVIHLGGTDFSKVVHKEFATEYGLNDNKIVAWSNTKVLKYNAHIRTIRGLPKLIEPGETLVTNNAIMSGKYYAPVDATVTITDSGDQEDIHGVWGRWLTLDDTVRLFCPNDYSETKAVMKSFASKKQWTHLYEIKNTWLDLRDIHACTVHKSQGSTYKNVFIDLNNIGMCHIPDDVARMLYVATSRASEKVYLYGNLPEKYGGFR